MILVQHLSLIVDFRIAEAFLLVHDFLLLVKLQRGIKLSVEKPKINLVQNSVLHKVFDEIIHNMKRLFEWLHFIISEQSTS